MFESFGRGFRMIWASIKMGWQDKRLLIPSLLTVFLNFIFAILLIVQAKTKVGTATASNLSETGHNLMRGANHGGKNLHELISMTALNGPLDQSGFSALTGAVSSDAVLGVTGVIVVWWLCNRFLEGVTTALVYSHLTEGAGSGKFSVACQAVLSSLPAIVILGLVTLIAKKLASFMRNKRGSGVFSFGVNFLAGIVEVFWTLAGHLILPSIVIEGTSFWGAMKRADRIASGNLLTIGVGEVGVDSICRAVSGLVYIGGLSGFGAAWYLKLGMTSPVVILGAVAWASLVVLVTAMSIYIRSAFYTCLYVWAIEVESVAEAERVQVRPPAPLATALA